MTQDVSITADDQQKIDDLVSRYRHSLEHIYQLAYLQGQIDSDNKALDALRKDAP